MKRIGLTLLSGLFVLSIVAQNLELRSGKDLKQPGKINPALSGVQEDFVRVLTESEIGNSYQFILDGKIPLKLGNYMIGYERLFTDNVQDNMFTISYGNEIKRKNDALLKKNKKPWHFRYGINAQLHTKKLLGTGFDSSAGYNFMDINGQTRHVPQLSDLNNSINYLNIELGAGFDYKNLFGAIGVSNILSPNVSLIDTASRKLPISGNIMVGGFINAGERFTVFPTVLVEYNEETTYSKVAIDAASPKLTLQASFIHEGDVVTQQNISGAIGYRFKKNSLIGVKYTHPLDGGSGTLVNTIPSFNVFLNASILKRGDMFLSDLGKQLKMFY